MKIKHGYYCGDYTQNDQDEESNEDNTIGSTPKMIGDENKNKILLQGLCLE